jgi:hypothetical protein
MILNKLLTRSNDPFPKIFYLFIQLTDFSVAKLNKQLYVCFVILQSSF